MAQRQLFLTRHATPTHGSEPMRRHTYFVSLTCVARHTAGTCNLNCGCPDARALCPALRRTQPLYAVYRDPQVAHSNSATSRSATSAAASEAGNSRDGAGWEPVASGCTGPLVPLLARCAALQPATPSSAVLRWRLAQTFTRSSCIRRTCCARCDTKAVQHGMEHAPSMLLSAPAAAQPAKGGQHQQPHTCSKLHPDST